jgi:hypothetical protein
MLKIKTIRENMKSLIPFVGGLLLIAVAMLLLTGTKTNYNTEETTARISSYTKKKINGTLKDVAVVTTDANISYTIPYSCLNGVRQVGGSVELTVLQKIHTYMYIINIKQESAVSKSSNICVKY